MTIIKPNNMAYHYHPLNKNINMTFLHSGRVWVWVRGGYIYPRYPSRIRILKSGKTHTQTQSNRGWFGRVPMGTGFVAMPTWESIT